MTGISHPHNPLDGGSNPPRPIEHRLPVQARHDRHDFPDTPDHAPVGPSTAPGRGSVVRADRSRSWMVSI
jgi:hypothetical protein